MDTNNVIIQFPILAKPPLTEEAAIQEMTEGLNTLIKIGAVEGPLDDILIDYEVNLDGGMTIAYLKEDCLYDASKLNTVGSSNAYEFPKDLSTEVDLSEFDKTYSAASIQERMRVMRMNPKLRLRYTVMDYKRFYNGKKKDFEKHPEKFEQLRNMFLTDLMGLFTEILPYIEEGKQLNSLIGVSQVSPKMSQVARELSLVYRRALKSEKSTGQINKSIFQRLKTTYAEFMNQLMDTVFPGWKEIMAGGGKDKKTKTSRVQPLNKKSKAASETETEEIEGADKEIESNIRSKSYSILSDGRISLFSEMTE